MHLKHRESSVSIFNRLLLAGTMPFFGIYLCKLRSNLLSKKIRPFFHKERQMTRVEKGNTRKSCAPGTSPLEAEAKIDHCPSM